MGILNKNIKSTMTMKNRDIYITQCFPEGTLNIYSRECFQDYIRTLLSNPLISAINTICECGKNFKFTDAEQAPFEDLICDVCGRKVIIYRKGKDDKV